MPRPTSHVTNGSEITDGFNDLGQITPVTGFACKFSENSGGVFAGYRITVTDRSIPKLSDPAIT